MHWPWCFVKNGKSAETPMSTTLKLDEDEHRAKVDITRYRGMIGSLVYLIASRPDIMFSVCLYTRFQSCLKESHLSEVKRIFCYLLRTINLGFDADFVGCKIDRKSTSNTCDFRGSPLVSWSSKKQNSIALSTIEAEYIAASSCYAQELWIKQTL